ncbi:hypothetical protein LUZ60_011433 [Juncus effusus]|nr:hypothetical protein LUZ60_011433 [Juncus effusus]
MNYYLASKLSLVVFMATSFCAILLTSYCLVFCIRRISNTRLITATRSTAPTIGISFGLIRSPSSHLGLSPKTLETLPVFVYRSLGEDKIECVICISELQDGEKGRRLPQCGHNFHADCVDVWFKSHSTCPICRSSMDSSSSELLV